MNHSNAMLLDAITWNEAGLVPAIAQDVTSGEVLMLAWMNRESLEMTLQTGDAHYWSRSRQSLWKKGESSGHIQHVKELRLDCDGDTILLKVAQVGSVSCHSGRRHCFFQRHDDGRWIVQADEMPVLTSSGPFSVAD